MNFLNAFSQLFEIEDSYQDLNQLLKINCDFEEIPLMTRVGREKVLIDEYGKENINAVLLNAALFCLANLELLAKKKKLQSHLYMITYPDVESDLELFGCYIPNLCIFKKEYISAFTRKNILSCDQAHWLFDSLNKLGFEDLFDLRFHQTLEFGERSTRIYLIPKK